MTLLYITTFFNPSIILFNFISWYVNEIIVTHFQQKCSYCLFVWFSWAEYWSQGCVNTLCSSSKDKLINRSGLLMMNWWNRSLRWHWTVLETFPHTISWIRCWHHWWHNKIYTYMQYYCMLGACLQTVGAYWEVLNLHFLKPPAEKKKKLTERKKQAMNGAFFLFLFLLYHPALPHCLCKAVQVYQTTLIWMIVG